MMEMYAVTRDLSSSTKTPAKMTGINLGIAAICITENELGARESNCPVAHVRQ